MASGPPTVTLAVLPARQVGIVCFALFVLIACGGEAESDSSAQEWVSTAGPCREDLPLCPSGVVPIDGCFCQPQGTPPACTLGEYACPSVPDGGCIPCTDGRWRRPPDDE